jgi:hypothetical protein
MCVSYIKPKKRYVSTLGRKKELEYKKMFVSEVDEDERTNYSAPFKTKHDYAKALFTYDSIANSILKKIVGEPFNVYDTPYQIETEDRFIKYLVFIAKNTESPLRIEIDKAKLFVAIMDEHVNFYRNEILQNEKTTEC